MTIRVPMTTKITMTIKSTKPARITRLTKITNLTRIEMLTKITMDCYGIIGLQWKHNSPVAKMDSFDYNGFLRFH